MFTGLELAQENPRRRWTALVSFTMQVGLVATLLVLPLFRPLALPNPLFHPPIFVPVFDSIVTTTTTEHPHSGHLGPIAPVQALIVAPDHGIHYPVPNAHSTTGTVVAPNWLVSSDASDGGRDSISNLLAIPVPKPIFKKEPRISVMMEGNLVHRVQPAYPQIAILSRVQGPVVIKAVISREGRIEQEQVVSGSPLLSPAALQAIRHWLYRPYYLNGEPIEVETEITVNFILQR